MDTEVATKFLHLQQMEKACHVVLYMRLVDALWEACIVVMMPGDTRALVSRNRSISRRLDGSPKGMVVGISSHREVSNGVPLKEIQGLQTTGGVASVGPGATLPSPARAF